MVVPLILASCDTQDSSSISSSISSLDSSSSTSSSYSLSSSSDSSSEPVDLTNYHEVIYSYVFTQDEFSGKGYETTAGANYRISGGVFSYEESFKTGSLTTYTVEDLLEPIETFKLELWTNARQFTSTR